MKLVKDSEETPANQMSLISDTDEIVKFLEFVGKKSILNEHAINCRLTACNNLFSILNEGEDNVEYMLQNLDLLVNRFRNKQSNVQDSTLRVYKSRLKSSLEDYVAWSKDPVAWEKSVLDKSNAVRAKGRSEKKANGHSTSPAPTEPAAKTERKGNGNGNGNGVEASPETSSVKGAARRVSFPIRNDFNLELVIPKDGLTLKELIKLGLFLYPYCKESELNAEPLAWSLIPRVTN
jgi:hypothetical protein